MGLFDTVTQGVDLFRRNADGASDPESILIDDEFEIDLAGIVDVVDDDSHDVLQLEGNVADTVPYAHIGDLFYLPRHILEEEVPLLPGDFR